MIRGDVNKLEHERLTLGSLLRCADNIKFQTLIYSRSEREMNVQGHSISRSCLEYKSKKFSWEKQRVIQPPTPTPALCGMHVVTNIDLFKQKPCCRHLNFVNKIIFISLTFCSYNLKKFTVYKCPRKVSNVLFLMSRVCNVSWMGGWQRLHLFDVGAQKK
jgi:hypothetical protein